MSSATSAQLFSEPENDHQVMASWERFLNGDEGGADALRRLIDDSWRRCQGASVDPAIYQAPPPIKENSLHSLQTECSELLTASTPVMAAARDFLAETGTVMVLTDQSGTILNLEGDMSTRGAAEDVHLLSGANWSELACGTNAIGTALAVGHAVQIHSAEHYCAGIKRWSCAATVVRDPYDKSILGVVDVSALTESYNRLSLALVLATAGRIENRLAKLELDIRYRLLEECVDRLARRTTDGVIVFDRRGRAIKSNGRSSTIIADLGIDAAVDGPEGLSSISLRWNKRKDSPVDLPDWIRREWVEPVIENGEHIGSVLTLPNRRGSMLAGSSRGSLSAASGDAADQRGFEKIIGKSDVLMQAVGRAQQLAKSRVPVLLLGETGVGKDVFARCIHESGALEGAPFVALNCGGFSRELLSSELFGYAEGAFTGARQGGAIGKIEAASGGSLFLDEIGEMPLDLQPHFLRVLEEGEVYRIGENKPRKVNFRLIAATNRDLRKEIQSGGFRMDLFYRVAVTSINIPSLRARSDDIALLGEHFLTQLSQRHGMPLRTLSPAVLTVLQQHAWPGNIREFRNVMESMLLTSGNTVLDVDDLPPHVLSPLPAASRLPAPSISPSGSVAAGPVADSAPSLTSLENAEREVIVTAIIKHGGNMTAAAREAGIAKSTLYVKLKRFGIDEQLKRSGLDGLTRGRQDTAV
ncbi:sigma-54-dependent Fis family transcriptional regulator [Methyloversatilis sp.]|uniref:sigma-54-dependent Fis family transcriptional regulator n=1 Tax=Methyloversatilis sp. TaxID=2569862 RepID=UPI002737453B|nr:sigma-54-dependent Fis family transcriptional regulator [Methyloversatilis sp.]MDP3455711.1 sigma-54-dependent Fis family transcriptional regulator [Methyloversatilis sp.]MDP3579655.1 sigma-54-dependent Fis family transcriptional regulator [Methyloversatilis sp.]